MRLTLRTMLAYMDDILEPSDAEDIRKKMEDSKFASELAQRIRDCVRNLRLPAPSLQGRGLGLDANSVAKYLDNELPAERVADFEKICLESDKHLAEVAACHQILTLVLGEPADVDPGARERMYGLSDLADAVGPAPEAPPTQAPPLAPPIGGDGASLAAPGRAPMSDDALTPSAAEASRPAGKRAKLEVPEYLREKRASRFWPVAAVALVAFVLTAGIFALIAPPELRQQLSGVLQNSSNDENSRDKNGADKNSPDKNASGAGGSSEQVGDKAESGAGTSSGKTPSDLSPTDKVPTDKVPTDKVPTDKVPTDKVPTDRGPTDSGPMEKGPGIAGPGEGAAAPLGPADGASPAIPGVAPGIGQPSNPAMTAGGEAGGAAPAATLLPPGEASSPAGGGSSPIIAGAPGEVPTGLAPAVAGGAGQIPAGPAAMPDAVASLTPSTPLNPGAAAPGVGAPLGGGAAGGPEAPPWHAGEEMGRYISEQDALLKVGGGRSWERLAPKSPIIAGEHLLSLPGYRSAFTLTAGISVQMIGPSEITVRGIDTQGVPTIAIRYGRLLALTIGKAGARLRIEFGDRSGLVTFNDTTSGLALEVDQQLLPGVDPETETAPIVASIFATSGTILWEERGKTETMQGPAGRWLAPLPIAELSGAEMPKWIAGDSAGLIDQKGAAVIEKDLTPDRSVTLAIKELSENQRTEVRALATRCAGYLNMFDPMVNALGNDLERNDWNKHIEALRAALARDPDTAALVRAAFEKHHGADGAKLYRMLWGYSPEQFKGGAAQQLVEDLNNDSLDYRVLAFWNLKNITGLTLFYRPEYPEAKRRQSFTRWKERWREGKLVMQAATKTGARPGARAGDAPDQ